MRPVVILGAGSLGSALVAALEHSGVTVILAERVAPSPIPDFAAALDGLVLDAQVREIPQHIRPLPIPRLMGERLPPQARPVPRWLPRPREQRTKGQR
jgi:2-polyprenyl-6-methoxyphenol hydroxylase-like FAD-dependent oxidoreductase